MARLESKQIMGYLPIVVRHYPALVAAVTEQLLRGGYAHPSFGFNVRSDFGHCYVCGSILLTDICAELGIHSGEYDGLYMNATAKN